MKKLYGNLSSSPEYDMMAKKNKDAFEFNAFGKKCRICPDGIILGSEEQTGVFGILISLYALHAKPDMPVIEPLKSFKEFPDSAPYSGAFITHTQNILLPHVDTINKKRELILNRLDGKEGENCTGGDFTFLLKPLPKIYLCYIFYFADEDFPASVTCLYSNNAIMFMPIDGLADVGEYTSKEILDIIRD